MSSPLWLRGISLVDENNTRLHHPSAHLSNRRILVKRTCNLRVSFQLGLSILLFFSVGCTADKGFAERASTGKQDAEFAEDASRFLAGFPCRTNSSLSALELTSSWQRYANQLNHAWSDLDKSRLQHARAFEERELSSIDSDSSFVFYPFSGPDVLYPTLFFPNCRLFVLAGLQPVGSLQDLYAYREDNIELSLRGWSNSLASFFSRSFFVTGEMDREFRGRVADGLLPMILLLLARSGYTIDGMAYGNLSSSGEFVARERTGIGLGHAPTPGVEIEFHRENDSISRTLYYFSTDLAAGFDSDPRLPRFLDRLGRCDTLLKSTSFLPHWRMCDAVRDYILRHSNVILQDDTGVPFRYFEGSKWQVQLFGTYSHPDRPFQHEYQRDLAEAFRDKAHVHPLGFSLGYGAGRRPSMLMLAHRLPTSR